jgi:hypothetical protein
VQWKGQPVTEATWTDLAAFQETYPSFQLEDELLAEGGRDVMVGKQYTRRRHGKQSAEGSSNSGN